MRVKCRLRRGGCPTLVSTLLKMEVKSGRKKWRWKAVNNPPWCGDAALVVDRRKRFRRERSVILSMKSSREGRREKQGRR